jgi:hypothetical protein
MNSTSGVLGVFGFSVIKGAATFDLATVTDLRDMVQTALSTNQIDDQIHVGYAFAKLTVTSYDQPSRAQIALPMSLAGNEAGQSLPWNVAAITSFRTDLAGPAHRGRSYLPGLTEASSNANTYDATSSGHLADFWDDVVTGLAGIGISGLGVMTKNSETLSPDITPVTSIIVESFFATQRRRLGRARSG